MKINRWISLPLYFAVTLSLLSAPLAYFLLGEVVTFEAILGFFALGAFSGFFVQLWSDLRARSLSGKNSEEIYEVSQKRAINLLLSYERSFEFCREALNSLNSAEIKREDLENGVIAARTGMSIYSFGQKIKLNLKKVNENLTEVEVLTRPAWEIVKVDYGESWKYAEDICNYLKEKNTVTNQNVLVESGDLLNEVYVRPFQKEKV